MNSHLAVIAAAALLTACSPSGDRKSPGSSSAASPVGGTLIISLAGDATDLFPPFVGDLTARLVQDQVFDRLAEIGHDLQTVGDKGFTPRLARSWTWAPDSLSIAFSLDPRARWHDGQPVTARDVRYSFWAFTDPTVGSPVAPLLSNLDSVSIRDSLTPVVWFKKRTPEQFYDVAYQLVVIPEHVYGSIPAAQLRTSPRTRILVGTGQFRFVKWDQGTRLELIADTSNFRGRAKLDRVILAPTASAQTRAAQLLSGESDFAEAFPTDQEKELAASPSARPIVTPISGYGYMAMNHFARGSTARPHPIFSDRRVRRALAMSVDRVAMLRNVFGNDGRLAHGPFPSVMPYADTTLQLPPYDTLAARALLDSAGWRVGADGVRSKGGRPLRFSILIPTTSAMRQVYGVLMQEYFRKVGARVDLDVLDGKATDARRRSGDFDSILWTFLPDPSPSGTKQNWGTAGIGGAGQNFLRYSNRTVDALLDSSSSSFDPATMKRYSSRAFQAIIDDAPAIFLYDITLLYGVNRRVTVAPMRTDEWWANLADWSIPTDKRIDRDRIGLRPASP